jgi:KDO2-lipid IV(A) lauroyltransferase
MARRWAFYALVRGLVAVLRPLPRPVTAGVLAGLGRVAWATRAGDRRTAERQLAVALPTLGPSRRRRLARRAFVDFGRNLADAVHGGALEIRIGPEALGRLEEAERDGRPLLVLTAHLGCWERLGAWLAARWGGLGVVTASPHNHWVDGWLRRERRRRGMEAFDRRSQPLAAARWLRRGRPLAVLADHRGGAGSVAAPWFGRPAPTVVGPGRLARRCAARILPVGIRRAGKGHEVLVGTPVPWEDSADEVELARRCNGAIEELILAAPTEWTWFHPRYGDGGRRKAPLEERCDER